MGEESFINIPLKPAVKKALQERAKENGRVMMREAAKIIEAAVINSPTPAIGTDVDTLPADPGEGLPA